MDIKIPLKFEYVYFFLSACCFGQALPEGTKNSITPPKVSISTSEYIFNEAPFLQCHAPTVTMLSNGEIMAAWFGGTYESNDDVSIYESHTIKGKWSIPKQIANGIENDTVRYPTWNPVLFKNKAHLLFLFYKIGPSPATWWGAYKTSTDNGSTWSAKTMLPKGIFGPIKNKPIQLENGSILSPSSIESNDGAVWKAHVEISEDDGHTWQKSLIPSEPEAKLIQPSLIQMPDHSVKALLRSNQNVLMESSSKDYGKTWSKAIASTIKNPNSGIDAVTLANGNFLLVYNPTRSGKDWSDGRQKLHLAFSRDGSHWVDILKLENQEKGEFSYPAIIQDNSGNIHMVYTYHRTHIKYLKLRLED